MCKFGLHEMWLTPVNKEKRDNKVWQYRLYVNMVKCHIFQMTIKLCRLYMKYVLFISDGNFVVQFLHEVSYILQMRFRRSTVTSSPAAITEYA